MSFLHIFILSLVTKIACDRQNLSKAALALLDKELGKLSCDKNAPTKELLGHQRLTQTNTAIACHLTYLKNHPDDSWIWSSLGQLYLQNEQNSQASTCFKQAAKFLGRMSTHVTDWFFLGPFPIGKAEVDGDPIEFYGGVNSVSRRRYKKDQKFLSELSANGEIGWKVIHQSKPDENVRFQPEVNWNELVQSLGSMGITEFQAWAVGDFVITQDDVTVAIQCLGVHTVFVDDVMVAGEIYWREQHSAFLPLNAGIHTIYTRVRSKGNANFRCSLREQTAAFNVLSPSFLPDLVDGYLFSHHIGLPIVNSHGSNWLRDIRLKVDDVKTDADFPIKLTPLLNIVAIAPGQTLSVPIQLSIANGGSRKILHACTGNNVLKIPMKVLTSEGTKTFGVDLRCRTMGQSFLFTFLDHDGSVQHGAAIAPRGQCDLNTCPVVLTLHGTTVPPQNQADSYKHMENGEFVFGFENAWVLAPTRHGAHNWEGPGALTAFAALHSLQKLASQHDWLSMKVSSRHVIYAGHSMGGHGAWHLATHYPDLGLALLSLAGWISKEQYGDSNLFFKHDVAVSHTDPALKAVLEACVGENDVDKHASNLKGMPVLMRVGQQDRTVHPYYGRRMYRVLREWGVNVTYVEVPGKEHWWWDSVSTNDGGCMNDKSLRQFVTRHAAAVRHQTQCQGQGDEQQCDRVDAITASSSPDDDVTFTLTVTNPAFAGPMRGCAIHQQLVPHRASHISVQVAWKDRVAVLRTVNVRCLSLAVSTLRPIPWFTMDVQVDSTVLSRSVLSGVSELYLCRHTVQGVAEWRQCTEEELVTSDTHRGSVNLGPARRVAEAPFYIVIGTRGSSESSLLIQQLAVYISNQFLLTSDSLAPLIRDVDLTAELAEHHNLIVIGNPVENAMTSQLLQKTSLSWDSGRRALSLGSCVFDEPVNGAVFLAPHAGTRLALVVMGNSLAGLRDAASLAIPTIPPMTRSPFSNLIPDVIITGPRYRAMGAGGYLCAGFWSNTWQAERELLSCAHCLV